MQDLAVCVPGDLVFILHDISPGRGGPPLETRPGRVHRTRTNKRKQQKSCATKVRYV